MNGAFEVHTGSSHTPESAIEGLLPEDVGWVFIEAENFGETSTFRYVVAPRFTPPGGSL